MRPVLIALAMWSLAPAVALAQPAQSATAPAAHFSTAHTPVSDILANPAAKAVLDARLPLVSNSEHIAMIGAMTLKDLQQYSPTITDEVLAAIDADFARLPAQ